MQTLRIEPVLPFLLPQVDELTIALVGCGGTGSHIAQSLARLAAHCRDTGGPHLQLAFIDGDAVEHKNVGRQLFSASDVGKNKAQILAARFSALFGLKILAFPQMLNGQHLKLNGGLGILVGAVDGAAGRREIVRELDRGANWRLWLDCGNHEHSGQVCVGSTSDRDRLKKSLGLGICGALPTPSLVYPDLLVDAPPRPRADCAAAMQDNAQSLMVNQTMAAIAAQYLYQIVVARRLTTFETVVDLQSLSMRSRSITATNLAEATGLTVKQLTTQPKPKARAA